MALTRARVISSSPEFRAQDRKHHSRGADAAARCGGVATDVADMRRAVALEKGEDDIWDLKYAAGGIVDIDFIAQYLQLVHAADKPDILDVYTLHVLDNAARLGVLPESSAEILRSRGAPLSRPDANPAALRQREIQAGDGRGGSPARAGAGRRRPGFFLARGAGQGDPDRGAPGVPGR